MKGYLNITQLSRIKHITTETLRHYDRIGLFVPDYMDPVTRYRYYSLSQVEKIDTILELRDMGMSLKDIKDFMEHRNVELSYQLLVQKEKELEKEIREKRVQRKMLQEKIHYMDQYCRKEPEENSSLSWGINYLEEEQYVVSEKYQTEMDEYILDVTMLKQNLKGEKSVFATNYVGSVIEMNSFLDDTEKQFARRASLPAEKCRKDLVVGTKMVMPAGEYLCGRGRGFFRYGSITERQIKEWLTRNHYEICGNIFEYDEIDLAVTNKEEEIEFIFKIPVKKC